MLDNQQRNELALLVSSNLDRAESVWTQVGKKLTLAEASANVLRKSAELAPSRIPGHEWVSDGNPIVDSFVAFVADMRDSTGHLLQSISARDANVSQLQRVYYETSALLPALAKTVSYKKNGRVTEYLGDGVLALFQVESGSEKEAIYGAYNAAMDCIGDARAIVNSELRRRYRLPELSIGVGLSCSRAIVTLVGLAGEKHPKAIGECIYRAAKLSKGTNEIYVDGWLQKSWPTEKGGRLRFSPKKLRGEDGYLVSE